MAGRALGIHRTLLRRFADGQPIIQHSPCEGDLRGYRTALSTLSRWGALDAGGITQLGRDLLAELDRRSS